MIDRPAFLEGVGDQAHFDPFDVDRYARPGALQQVNAGSADRVGFTVTSTARATTFSLADPGGTGRHVHHSDMLHLSGSSSTVPHGAGSAECATEGSQYQGQFSRGPTHSLPYGPPSCTTSDSLTEFLHSSRASPGSEEGCTAPGGGATHFGYQSYPGNQGEKYNQHPGFHVLQSPGGCSGLNGGNLYHTNIDLSQNSYNQDKDSFSSPDCGYVGSTCGTSPGGGSPGYGSDCSSGSSTMYQGVHDDYSNHQESRTERQKVSHVYIFRDLIG